MGVALAMQPAFNHYWPHDGEEYPRVVGVERAQISGPGLQDCAGRSACFLWFRCSRYATATSVGYSQRCQPFECPNERIPVETAPKPHHRKEAPGSHLKSMKKAAWKLASYGDLVSLLGEDPYKVPAREN